MNIEQIRKHIDNLIKEKGKNYRSLSLAVGKNEAYLHQYINKGSPVRLPENERRKLAQLLEVDEQELTDIKLPKKINPEDFADKTAIIEMIDPSSPDTPSGQTFWSMPKTDYSNMTSSSAENIKICRIFGDSMNPTLKDGDFVLIDKTINKFSGDGLYLIKTINTASVRRLQAFSLSEVLIISDNSFYKSATLNLENVKIIGKVILALKAEKI